MVESVAETEGSLMSTLGLKITKVAAVIEDAATEDEAAAWSRRMK